MGVFIDYNAYLNQFKAIQLINDDISSFTNYIFSPIFTHLDIQQEMIQIYFKTIVILVK
jgi:hypothetical protein